MTMAIEKMIAIDVAEVSNRPCSGVLKTVKRVGLTIDRWDAQGCRGDEPPL